MFSDFAAPTTTLGSNELSIAGALRGKAVEMVQCKTINEKAIAHAEIVIEGELLPNARVREDQNTNTGRAMPPKAQLPRSAFKDVDVKRFLPDFE